jgi:hypothetical protein
MKSVRLVPDLAENLPADTAYTALKNRLMDSPFLTNFQKIERLHLLDNLGARNRLNCSPRGLSSALGVKKQISFSCFCFFRAT